jgi:hypothetical protein
MKIYAKSALYAITLALLLACAPALWGQGCAMCNENAKAAPQKTRAALNRSIVILLIPPVGMMIALVGYTFWRSERDIS